MATTSLDPVLRHIRQLMEITPSLADGELLERFVRQREEGAFEALMRRHGPMVLGVGRRVLHDRDAAADIFRATFLVLAHHACSLNRRGSVAGWLYTVAYPQTTAILPHSARRTSPDAHIILIGRNLALLTVPLQPGLDLPPHTRAPS